MNKKASLFGIFVIALLLLFSSWIAANYFTDQKSLTDIAKVFEERLNEQSDKLENYLSEFAETTLSPKQKSDSEIEKYNNLYKTDRFIFIAYKNRELLAYTDNHIPVLQYDSLFYKKSTKILLLQNGWYLPIYKTKGDFLFVGLHLVKNNFVFENKYLENNFFEIYQLPKNAQIYITNKNAQLLEIRNDHLKESFFLSLAQRDGFTDGSILSSILYAIGILVLIYSILVFIVIRANRFTFLLKLISIVVLVFFVRWLSLNLSVFEQMYGSKLFDPSLYASSAYFPSLGDLGINALIFLMTVYFIKKIFLQNQPLPKGYNLVYGIVIMTGVYCFGWMINSLLQSLVESSKISLNINNLFEVTTFGIVGFICLGILFLAFSQFSVLSLLILQKSDIKRKSILVITGLGLLFIGVGHVLNEGDLIFLLWPACILLLCFLSVAYNSKLIVLITSISSLIIFSFLSGYSINKYSNNQQNSEQLLLAEKLSVNDDPVTEFLFSKIEFQIEKDDSLITILSREDEYSTLDIEAFLTKKYFSGYWNKYKINAHIFSNNQAAWGKQPYQKPKSIEELDTIIINYGTKVEQTAYLFHIYNKGNLLSYVAKIPFQKSDSGASGFVIILEFTSKILSSGEGFPELLIDNNVSSFNNFSKYSTARYIGGQLISKTGSYPYELMAGVFEEQNENISSSIINRYKHLIYRVDKNTFVIVSKKTATFYEQFTKYSYFFLFFGFMLIVWEIVLNFLNNKPSWSFGLSYKIQSTLILFGVTSLFVFGFAIRHIIIQQNNEKNQKLVAEKTLSILIELKEKLDDEEELNYFLTDYIDGLLAKWSRVFFSDINVFDLKGNLISTSQRQIYSEGLLASKINPVALDALARQNKSEFFQNENLGKLNYLSSYMPLRNNFNNVIGYVSLPYFARQNELEEELSQFLVAIINVFFLLIILSILAALFVTEWITKPLVYIKEGLSKMELNMANQPIVYKQNDEVGDLVAAYNKKVAELELKAEQLAKSEREGAWREMAKQVAHEIKNPLTPMKLSVQLLQKAWGDKAPNFDDRIAKHSETIVQQIDALSNIAEEFSSFAKMPTPVNKPLDIIALIESVVELYTTENAYSISFKTNVFKPQFIFADSEQLLRVLNNLIKNAIQAIPNTLAGEIVIVLELKNGELTLSISDNGQGIADEDRKKIFSPNFTTKTSGSGLGLAMVKSIVEGLGGTIWYQTQWDKGTTFFINLPLAKAEAKYSI
jgi:two-component system, NtrC family, nitrogen regulation sensor histidine kinase NtrY